MRVVLRMLKKAIYGIIILLAVAAFLLQYDWLLFLSFALLLVVALLGYRQNSRYPDALPPGMVAPRQISRSPHAAHYGQAPGFGPNAGNAPFVPRKKKKIKRPIIIIQPPAHAEGLTHGILDESIKHSFPHFMTPQHKMEHEKDEAYKHDVMKLLHEQQNETRELRKKMDKEKKSEEGGGEHD